MWNRSNFSLYGQEHGGSLVLRRDYDTDEDSNDFLEENAGLVNILFEPLIVTETEILDGDGNVIEVQVSTTQNPANQTLGVTNGQTEVFRDEFVWFGYDYSFDNQSDHQIN